MLRIVMLDDHPLERDALAEALVRAGLEVVGQATRADEALALVARTAPDVALLDLRLSDALGAAEDEGLDVAEALRRARPEVGLLVRSAYAQPVYVQRLLALAGPVGAVGYLRKGGRGSLGDLVSAVREIAAGGIVVDPVISRTLLARPRPAGDPLNRLSPRERDVLERIAQGQSNTKIAGDLGSTVGTVEQYASRVFQKLEITSGPAGQRREQNARVLAVLTFLRHVAPPRTP